MQGAVGHALAGAGVHRRLAQHLLTVMAEGDDRELRTLLAEDGDKTKPVRRICVEIDEDGLDLGNGLAHLRHLQFAASPPHRRLELASEHEVVADQGHAPQLAHGAIIDGPMSSARAVHLYWTSDAVAAIRQLRETEGRPDAPFRVDVRLGGCQGFKLYFELDQLNEDDAVFEAAPDVRIVVQRDGLPMIAGGVVDYEDSHRGTGFRLANPQAEKACGCGQAFYANFESEEDARAEAAVVAADPQ